MEEILENPTTSPEVILIPENLTITQVVILGNLITILEEMEQLPYQVPILVISRSLKKG